MLYTKDKKVVINVRITTDDYEILKRLSNTSGLSISEIVRQSLVKHAFRSMKG